MIPEAPKFSDPPKPTMETTVLRDRSFLMLLLQVFVRPFGPMLTRPKKTYPPGSPTLDVPKRTRRKCTVSHRTLEDIHIYDLSARNPRRASITITTTASSPKEANPLPRQRIFYFAGGGWQTPPGSEHWGLCTHLATTLPKATISVVSAPLAPASPAPTAFPHLLQWFTAAMGLAQKAGEDVILMGDSSGGNLVLCIAIAALQAQTLSDQGTLGVSAGPLRKIIAISPSADLSHSNPDEERAAMKDPLESIAMVTSTGEKWVGAWQKNDPRVSPLYAEVGVLKRAGVEVYGISAGYDVLGPDALLLRDRCVQEGVVGAWMHGERQVHCWPLTFMYGFREAKESVRWVLEKITDV